jgi:hypothetical protein
LVDADNGLVLRNRAPQVGEPGCAGIGGKEGDAWKRYTAEIVGIVGSDEGERDRFHLRLDLSGVIRWQ